MKKILASFLLLIFINICVFAEEFDSSIDSSIRKNYNVEDSELPPLPKTVPTANEEVYTVPQKKYNATGKAYNIKKGTRVALSLNYAISDRSMKGSIVTFTSRNGFTTKEGAIIPAGTVFKGRIKDSHGPQLSGNGGLIELYIDEIYFNGVMSKISTKVSLANSKKVFLNNIKGKRRYWHNVSKALTPGRKFFGAMHNTAMVMWPVPVVNILSVVPMAIGTVVYTVNFAASPVIALFTKGSKLSLPAGTQFEIKLTQDCVIKG